MCGCTNNTGTLLLQRPQAGPPAAIPPEATGPSQTATLAPAPTQIGAIQGTGLTEEGTVPAGSPQAVAPKVNAGHGLVVLAIVAVIAYAVGRHG